jgi:hypothetical protein
MVRKEAIKEGRVLKRKDMKEGSKGVEKGRVLRKEGY